MRKFGFWNAPWHRTQKTYSADRLGDTTGSALPSLVRGKSRLLGICSIISTTKTTTQSFSLPATILLRSFLYCCVSRRIQRETRGMSYHSIFTFTPTRSVIASAFNVVIDYTPVANSGPHILNVCVRIPCRDSCRHTRVRNRMTKLPRPECNGIWNAELALGDVAGEPVLAVWRSANRNDTFDGGGVGNGLAPVPHLCPQGRDTDFAVRDVRNAN